MSRRTDISPYLVHFTQDGGFIPPLDADDEDASRLSAEVRRWPKGAEATAFERFMAILADRWVRAGARTFGAAKEDSRLGNSQRAVCFSEAPPGQLAQLVERRSPYGIAFRKQTIPSKGGARVWCLDRGDEAAKALRRLI